MANRSVREPDLMYESDRWVKESPEKASKGKSDLGCIEYVLHVNVTVVMQPIYLVVNKHSLEHTRPFTASVSLASNLTFYLYLLGSRVVLAMLDQISCLCYERHSVFIQEVSLSSSNSDQEHTDLLALRN